jgi:hypothetical protein
MKQNKNTQNSVPQLMTPATRPNHGRGASLAAMFPAFGFRPGIPVEALPTGYMVEYAANLGQGFAAPHAQLVQNATLNAAQNPVSVILLPTGYLG